MSDDLPEPWATWASRVGVRPSRTGIGEAANVPASTISRLLTGRTTARTVRAVADALRVTPQQVLAAATGDSRGPWTPPLEAHLLHSDEREALGLLIQRLTAGREGGTDAGTAEAGKKMGGSVVEADFGGGQVTTRRAARKGSSAGRTMAAETDRLGEGSQDDGTMEPS